MTGWDLMSLEIDEGGEDIGRYLFEERGFNIHRIGLDDFVRVKKQSSNKQHTCVDHNIYHPSYVRNKAQLINMFDIFTYNLENNVLAVYGSGSYHHFTFALCSTASRRSNRFSYIHFDAHTDVSLHSLNNQETVNCANFVGELLKDERNNVDHCLFVGAHFSHIPDVWSTSSATWLNSKKALDFLDKSLDNVLDDVYISFDLDVMDSQEIITGWPADGLMKKRQLLKMISLIKSKKNIIGADLLGFEKEKDNIIDSEDHETMYSRSRKLYNDIIDVLTAGDF